MLGTSYFEADTITPAHILGEYTDTPGTLIVDGNSTITGDLTVDGSSTIAGVLNVGTYPTAPSNATVSGALTVNGQLIFPPAVLGPSGSINIGFAGAAVKKQFTLTGDVTYTATSYVAGGTVTIRVPNGSTERNLTFPSGWVFVGTKPTTIAANKTGILTVTSFGTTEADCVAAWAVQE